MKLLERSEKSVVSNAKIQPPPTAMSRFVAYCPELSLNVAFCLFLINNPNKIIGRFREISYLYRVILQLLYCVILSFAKDLFTSTRQRLRCVPEILHYTSFRSGWQKLITLNLLLVSDKNFYWIENGSTGVSASVEFLFFHIQAPL